MTTSVSRLQAKSSSFLCFYGHVWHIVSSPRIHWRIKECMRKHKGHEMPMVVAFPERLPLALLPGQQSPHMAFRNVWLPLLWCHFLGSPHSRWHRPSHVSILEGIRTRKSSSVIPQNVRLGVCVKKTLAVSLTLSLSDVLTGSEPSEML